MLNKEKAYSIKHKKIFIKKTKEHKNNDKKN
jgi:hypothetical protein